MTQSCGIYNYRMTSLALWLQQSATGPHSERIQCEWLDSAGRSADGAEPDWNRAASSVNWGLELVSGFVGIGSPCPRNTRSSASWEMGIPVDFISSTKASFRVGGGAALLDRMGCDKTNHCRVKLLKWCLSLKTQRNYTHCCRGFMLQAGSKRAFKPVFQPRDYHST